MKMKTIGVSILVLSVAFLAIAGCVSADSVSGPAGTASYYNMSGSGLLNPSDGNTWTFVLAKVDDAGINYGTKAYQFVVHDQGYGSGYETIGIQVHKDFYGIGGHLMQFFTCLPSDDWGWFVRSSHGFNVGEIFGHFAIRIDLAKQIDGTYIATPYFRLSGGDWTIFWDGMWQSSLPGQPGSFDLTQTELLVQIDGGADGTLVFDTPVASSEGTWYVYAPTTIQAAIDEASDGDKILVSSGKHYGAIITKAVQIVGEKGAIIFDGPAHPRYPTLHYGFKIGYGLGGDGASIGGLVFECAEPSWTVPGMVFPIFASQADGVTIHHNILRNPVQGITNWGGNGWNIHHNKILGLRTLNGGGIGIMVGVYDETTANDNLVFNNQITAEVGAEDYSVVGIGVFSDNRYGSPGGEVTGNIVSNNKLDVNGENAWGIELSALGLEEVPNGDEIAVLQVHGNSIIDNRLKECANRIHVVPEILTTVNVIENNK